MKTTKIMSLVLAVMLTGITATAFAEDKPANYIALKGGVYSPSDSYDVDNFNGGNRTKLDSTTGFAGEVAFGHYFMPMFALEVGAGYFESDGSAEAEPGEVTLKVIPAVATAKALLPLGIFEPYALFGAGAYFTDFSASENTGTVNGSTDVTYGWHAGAGLNVDFTDNLFAGVEAKYLWVETDFDGQDVNIDGFITTAVIGARF